MTLTRKQFLGSSLALIAGSLVGCASGDEVGDDLPPSDGSGQGPGDEGTLDEGPEDDGGTNLTGDGGSGGSGGSDGGAGGQGGGMGGQGGGMGGQGGDPGPTCGDDPTATPDHPWHPPFSIPLADVAAGMEQTYEVGSQNHSHFITLSVQDFADLQTTGQITVTSTNDHGHTHQVVVTCTVV